MHGVAVTDSWFGDTGAGPSCRPKGSSCHEHECPAAIDEHNKALPLGVELGGTGNGLRSGFPGGIACGVVDSFGVMAWTSESGQMESQIAS